MPLRCQKEIALSNKQPGKRHWGLRSFASLLVFVIAAALTPIAMIGHWGNRTIVDAEQYIATVGPLVDSPEIQEAISGKVTEIIVQQVDTTSIVDDFLGSFIQNPSITDKVAAPIAAGVNNLIGELVSKFVASDAFRDIWIAANVEAQKSMVALLKGKSSGPIQLKGDAVVLDVSSLLTAVQQRVVDSGLSIAANVKIPDNDRQIVLFESRLVGQIQFIYALTSPVLVWFPLIIALLFCLSIALARNRPRTALTTGAALIVLGGVALWLMDYAETMLTKDLQGSVLEGALTSFWNQFFQNLLHGFWAVVLLGIIVGLSGWYAGRSRPATSAREAVCRGLHELGPAGGALNSMVRSYGAVLRWLVISVLVLVLTMAGTISVWRVVWVCALAGGLITLIELFNGPNRDQYADVASGDSASPAATAEVPAQS